jgi:hypothetical protein
MQNTARIASVNILRAIISTGHVVFIEVNGVVIYGGAVARQIEMLKVRMGFSL